MKRKQRWAFSRTELLHPELCHDYDQLVATGIGEIGVMVLRNGTVTNRYADGIAGVSYDDKAYANEEESLTHPIGNHYEETEAWKDVIVGKQGEFVRFAK